MVLLPTVQLPYAADHGLLVPAYLVICVIDDNAGTPLLAPRDHSKNQLVVFLGAIDFLLNPPVVRR